MDDVANHCASSRPCDRSFQARTQRVDRIGPYATLKISNHHHQKAQARRNQGYQPPGMLQLRQERNNLARLCTQEHYAAFDPRRQQNGGLEHFRQIQNSRAIAERRYVGYLIRYLRNTGRMTPLEASQLQKDFTRQKMSDLNISRGHYLLDLYPTELS